MTWAMRWDLFKRRHLDRRSLTLRNVDRAFDGYRAVGIFSSPDVVRATAEAAVGRPLRGDLRVVILERVE
ncbi:MAG: hypothetical protein V4597_08430 [Pseudomonadota bacterium]